MTTSPGPDARGVRQHLSAEVLNDLVDGRLVGEERTRGEAHLATCVACRAEYDALREVVALGRTASSGMAVPPDVWVAVAAATVHERVVRRHILRSMRGVLAVMALAIAVASAIVSSLVTRAVLQPAATAGGAPAVEGRWAPLELLRRLLNGPAAGPEAPIPPEPPVPPEPAVPPEPPVPPVRPQPPAPSRS